MILSLPTKNWETFSKSSRIFQQWYMYMQDSPPEHQRSGYVRLGAWANTVASQRDRQQRGFYVLVSDGSYHTACDFLGISCRLLHRELRLQLFSYSNRPVSKVYIYFTTPRNEALISMTQDVLTNHRSHSVCSLYSPNTEQLALAIHQMLLNVSYPERRIIKE